MLKRSDYYYDLPKELIAQFPTEKRTDSRLLVLNKSSASISHHQFTDLVDFVGAEDCLVLNNTQVIRARVYGHKDSGGKIEILIEKIINSDEAWVHCKASKRPKLNQKLFFSHDCFAIVLADQKDLLQLKFNLSIDALLSRYGHIPLPPYLERNDEQSDIERYQTVYAQHKGSVAAPTAGLHFDKDFLKKFQSTFVTLHVGAGTFQPVKVDNISDHQMHYETAEISDDTVKKIREVKSSGGKIIAVGTTSVRTLETASMSGILQPFNGDTNLFITPGFQFHCIDGMLTNFHLPESTLLMLVSAFAGKENVMNAYQEAIKNQYRFFSYGDAMLVV